MRGRGREEAPSPLLFLAALPLALLLALGALLLLPDKPGDTIEVAEGPTGLRPSGEPPLRVVAIGTSLVRSGIDPGLVEAFAVSRGNAVRMRRVTCFGGHVGWVEPLLGDLARDPPDLLVLEAELLAWHLELPSAPKAGPALLRERRGYASYRLVGEMRKAVGLGVEVVREGSASPGSLRFADDLVDLLGAEGASGTGFTAGRYARRLSRMKLRDLDALGGILGRLDALKARGCRVVLLPMGRSPAAQAVFPAELSAAFAGFLDRLRARGFSVESERPPLEQRHYSDAAHLDAAGRSRFSEWFSGRIPRWMEGR